MVSLREFERDERQLELLWERLERLPDLQYLEMGNSLLTDDDLPELHRLKNLRRLRLPGGVTDAGLAHLHELKQLEQINLAYSQVSAEGVQQLRDALPNCHIED